MRYNSKEDYKLITRFHKDLLDPIEINGVLMPDRPTVTAEVNGVVKTDLRPIMGEDVAYAMELFCNLWLWCPESTWAGASPWYAYKLLEKNSIDHYWRITENTMHAYGPSCYWIARMFLRYGWNDIPGYSVNDSSDIFEFSSYNALPAGRSILINDNSKCIGLYINTSISHARIVYLCIRIHSGRTYEKDGKTYYKVEFDYSAGHGDTSYDGPYVGDNGKLIIDITRTVGSEVYELRAEVDSDVFSSSMHQDVGVVRYGSEILDNISVYEVADCSAITTSNAVIQQSSFYYDDEIKQFFISGGFNFDMMRKMFNYTFREWSEDRNAEQDKDHYSYPITGRELKWGLENIGIYNNMIISGTCYMPDFFMSNGRFGEIIDTNMYDDMRHAVSFRKQRKTLKEDLSGVVEEYSTESSDHYVIHIGMVKNVKMIIRLYYEFYNDIEDPHFNEEYIMYSYDVEKYRTKDSNGLDIIDLYAPTFFNDIKSYMNAKFNYRSYESYNIKFVYDSVFVGSFNYGT